jgi:hypothetical protein
VQGRREERLGETEIDRVEGEGGRVRLCVEYLFVSYGSFPPLFRMYSSSLLLPDTGVSLGFVRFRIKGLVPFLLCELQTGGRGRGREGEGEGGRG